MAAEPTKNDVASYRSGNARRALLDEVHEYVNNLPSGDVDVARRALATIRGPVMRSDIRFAAGRFYVLQPDMSWKMDLEKHTLTHQLLQRWCDIECRTAETFDQQLAAAWAANERAGADENYKEQHGAARKRFKAAVYGGEKGMGWRHRVQSFNTRERIRLDLAAQEGVLLHDGPEAFDPNPDVLAVGNGLLSLETGELRPLSAADLVTQRLTVNYNPQAKCPQWEKFLREVLITADGEPDEELIHWLQVLIGYGITGRANEQAFAVFFGKGANGKGVLIDVLTEIFAAITKTSAMSTFEVKQGNGPTSDQARLVGARLVFTSEGEVGARLSAANIKRFTGEDRVTARFMYATEFEFRPRFLLVMASNTKPHVIDSSEGYWRRVKLVPFRRYFEEHERDPRLRDKLLAEAEGILRWAVDGAREWYAKGLPPCATVRRETMIYRDSSDRLAEFMATRLDITGDRKHRTKATDVVKAYKAWAEDAGEEVKNQLSRSALLAALGERKGISTGSYAGQLHLYGVRVLGPAEVRQREVAAEKAERSLSVAEAGPAAG